MRGTRPGDDELESLLYPDEPFRTRLVRRSRWIAVQVSVFLLVTVLSPAVLVSAALLDLVLWVRRRKPWMATRLLALLWWGLFGELRGLLGLAAVRLATVHRRPRVDRRVFRLRRQWLGGHLRGLRRIFGLRFEIDGLEHAGNGPVVILIRHASTADTLLPETFVGIEHGMWLRYVLKHELLGLPTIDIGRRWVPTVFVRRGYGNTDGEVLRLRALAANLAPDEGLIIYPEGTFYSPDKLARAREIIAERQPGLAPLAERLRNLLPPKVAGAIALLEAAPNADVVIFGHVGLERFEHLRHVWSGELVGSTVRIKVWRYPAREVPRGDEHALAQWLYDRWLTLDDWIDGQRRGVAGGGSGPGDALPLPTSPGWSAASPSEAPAVPDPPPTSLAAGTLDRQGLKTRKRRHQAATCPGPNPESPTGGD
jgi:1-acyl-sn-glycerol-3-phosphate acyltransferase